MATRDYSLDYLRGVGCVMMVMAHLKVFDLDDVVTGSIHLVSSLAMMFFFSVAGATTYLQMSKYKANNLILFYSLVAIAGISYNTALHPNLFQFFTLEIFQIIAIGAIFIILLYPKMKGQYWLFGLLALALFGLKLLLSYLFPDLDGGGILLPRNDYIPHHLREPGQPLVLPGFPLLPWLFMFPAGVFAYSINNRYNFIFAAIFLSISLFMAISGENYRTVFDKWDMTPGFFCLTCSLMFGSYGIFRAWAPSSVSSSNPIILFGQNSLLLFFMHGFGLLAGIIIGTMLDKQGFGLTQYVAWFVAVLVSYIALKLVLKIRPSEQFLKPMPWAILIAAILAQPIIMLFNPDLNKMVQGLSILLGIVFAIHVPYLNQMIKQRG